VMKALLMSDACLLVWVLSLAEQYGAESPATLKYGQRQDVVTNAPATVGHLLDEDHGVRTCPLTVNFGIQVGGAVDNVFLLLGTQGTGRNFEVCERHDDFSRQGGGLNGVVREYRDQAKPPLTRITCAFTQAPSGPARNDTAEAISSGWPMRSIGAWLAICAINSSDLPLRNRSVSTGPGAMALTVMSRPRSSLAGTCTSP